MRIAIDISQVIYGTGTSVYTAELIKNLLDIYPENEFILFGGSLRRRSELLAFASSYSSVKKVIVPFSPTFLDLIWNKLHFLKIEKLTGKFNVLHTSDWTEPPSKLPKVTTIHDLAPVLLPEFTHPKIVEVHKRRLFWVTRESCAVIVPSESSKIDAIKFGIESERIRVIPEAIRSGFAKAGKKKLDEIKNKYKITGKYAFSVGVSPRKNTRRIIESFKRVRKETGLQTLVIAGSTANTKLKKNDFVSYLGHVPTNDLAALYMGSAVFLYPSLYEGFGLPILEAFASNTPVVTSNTSSMPEVAGDAAVLVDPESVNDIAEGIIKALGNSKKLIIKGRKRLKFFSWRKTATKTMKVYEECAKN